MKRTPGWAVSLLLLAALGAGCSKTEPPQILGHWRAERFKAFSVSLPVGPEFEVRANELVPEGADLHVPITSIERKKNEVTLELPAGIGLSFYFDGPDRMYLDLPLVGKIYYQRVKAPRPAAAVPAPAPAPAPQPTSQANAAPVNRMPTAAPTSERPAASTRPSAPAPTPPANEAMADYALAIQKMRQSDADGAIRHLNDAFRHGFRAFDALEKSVDLAPLKADVRYQALVARYR